MKIRLISVGKVREPYLAAACADFSARLQRYQSIEIREVAASHGADAPKAARLEAQRVLRSLGDDDLVWLLERDGTQLSSLELSQRLQAFAATGTTHLVLVVAGTFGAGEELRARADFCWSLSRLTLLHEWTRALVLEQLYRATKIARNEPYHH